MSQKLTFDNPQQQQLQIDMHHAFEKAQGYTPETLAEWPIQQCRGLVQYFNVASMIALK